MMKLNKIILSYGILNFIGCDKCRKEMQIRNLKLQELLRCFHREVIVFFTANFTFPFHFHALEKEMATHSSVLAWRISGTGEPGGLPSLGSHRVRHD